MTHGTRITSTLGLAVSALAIAGAANAANIQVVRDVSSRDARTLPIRPITVVRDVSARPAIGRRPAIKVVRDTPALDAAQAERNAAKAVAYFYANERATR